MYQSSNRRTLLHISKSIPKSALNLHVLEVWCASISISYLVDGRSFQTIAITGHETLGLSNAWFPYAPSVHSPLGWHHWISTCNKTHAFSRTGRRRFIGGRTWSRKVSDYADKWNRWKDLFWRKEVRARDNPSNLVEITLQTLVGALLVGLWLRGLLTIVCDRDLIWLMKLLGKMRWSFVETVSMNGCL